MINKATILVNRRRPVSVDVPEWGGTVFLVPMNLKDLLFLEQINRKDDHGMRADATATMLVRHLADASGNRIFDDADANQLIETQPATLLANLFARLAEISQPNPETAEKNSGNSR